MEDKEPMKPVLKPVIQTIIPTEENSNGGLIVSRKDDAGNEIPDSEFGTTTRMWDRVYSKDTNQNFFIKKK